MYSSVRPEHDGRQKAQVTRRRNAARKAIARGMIKKLQPWRD